MKKLLKRIGLGLGVLLGLFLLIGILMPRRFEVTKEIVVSRPVTEVYNYLKFLKNQEVYGVWYNMDPNMERSYEGSDGQIGFKMSWASNKKEVGKGSQAITALYENQRIETLLQFEEPFSSTSNSFLETELLAPGQTKIRWGMTGDFPYPMNVFLPFMNLEEAIGKDLEVGLRAVKGILEG
jgi:hypothetical protein